MISLNTGERHNNVIGDDLSCGKKLNDA